MVLKCRLFIISYVYASQSLNINISNGMQSIGNRKRMCENAGVDKTKLQNCLLQLLYGRLLVPPV